ncbi:MAG: cation:proton antiporter [Pseudomonadota bacterium]
MQTFLAAAADLAWPLALGFAWVLGELVHRWVKLPRISVYGLVGFLFSSSQLGLLSRPNESSFLVVANIAMGLMLFEFGYRINLGWLRTNQWVGASGLAESVATFFGVYWVAAGVFGLEGLTAGLLSALAVATSPAEVLRVVNEQRSSGQVTERAMHLSALNCILAVFLFNVVVGLWAFQSSGSAMQAISSSLLVIVVSAGLGLLFGAVVPALLRSLGNLGQNATIGFAIAVILLVSLAHVMKVSPVLAALTFGFVARQRRLTLNSAQRNFGALGDLLTVLLFVYVGAALAWPRVAAGLGLALALVGMRFATKVGGAVLFARVSGVSWRKGLLTGVALSPMSALVIALLVQTRYMGINLMDQLAPLAAATLLLDIAGPVLTQLALKWAGETPQTREH